jgi:putative endonuclease
MRDYYVYLMTNVTGMLYTGVTNNLERRVYEHKNKLIKGFTSHYNLDKLVFFECTDDITAAIAREKQIKGWLRKKKVALIETMNPKWIDLSKDWYDSSVILRNEVTKNLVTSKNNEILRKAQDDKRVKRT